MDINAIPIELKNDELDTWAFIEIFGHDQTAGRLRTRNFGTQVMIQVDIPKDKTEISHSRLLSPSAIFSIQPTTEEWCRSFITARGNINRPVLPFIPNSNKQIAPHSDDDIIDSYLPDQEQSEEEWTGTEN